MKLLIAEDEVDLAEALTAFLKKTNLPSTPYTTGRPRWTTPKPATMTPSS